MSVQTVPFAKIVGGSAIAAHGHQSSFQPNSTGSKLALQSDVEKRIQAAVARDGIRIRQFFIDFDKLRKGTVGEAAVSIFEFYNRF